MGSFKNCRASSTVTAPKPEATTAAMALSSPPLPSSRQSIASTSAGGGRATVEPPGAIIVNYVTLGILRAQEERLSQLKCAVALMSTILSLSLFGACDCGGGGVNDTKR